MSSEGTPLVSVVVPVHNAERYLSQCLESLLAQSIPFLEIIAVDDASTDSSPATLALFAERDPRLRVVTLPSNRGVSAARNAGMAVAVGEFIAFVDADDYVEAGMYEDLVAQARSLQCDVVSCGMRVVDADGATRAIARFPLESGTRYDRADMGRRLHTAWSQRLLWYPFRSVYRRELLLRHGLRFEEDVRKGEDSLFNLQALTIAVGVSAVDDAFYSYRKHGDSATARPLASESANIEALARNVLAFYGSNKFERQAYEDFYGHLLRSDLASALIRLRAHPDAGPQIRALVESSAVRAAFRQAPVRRLRAPARVKLLLILARLRAVSSLLIVLGLYDAMTGQPTRLLPWPKRLVRE